MATPLLLPAPSPKLTKTPLKVLATYQARRGQSRHFHRMPSGLRVEVISQKGLIKPQDPDSGEHPNPEPEPELDPDPKPALAFVHGSFHAAWCWAEHWLPFFFRRGYDCYAVGLLARGRVICLKGHQQTNTSDIADFIRREVRSPPVLIGHSFGGLIVQSYLSNRYSSHHSSSSESEDFPPLLAGAVLVCSVPPSGNSGLVWRYLLTKPVAAIKVTLSLAAKAFANFSSLCKETFFSSMMIT